MADTKQWPRKPRSNSNWHHLSAREIDTGKRWSIIWDVVRKPGIEGRNTAPYEPSDEVWIHDNDASYIGRNAVSSIDVTDVLVEDNSFTKIGMDAWDL